MARAQKLQCFVNKTDTLKRPLQRWFLKIYYISFQETIFEKMSII